MLRIVQAKFQAVKNPSRSHSARKSLRIRNGAAAFVEGNRRGRVRSPMIPSQKALLRVGQVTDVEALRSIGRY